MRKDEKRQGQYLRMIKAAKFIKRESLTRFNNGQDINGQVFRSVLALLVFENLP
jgi:hypothetical protein